MDVEFQNGKILHGDVLERLKDIPDESVDVISTSPPYWGLRDYGVKGQLGLEPDFRDYLKKMYSIMDELKRVLKKTGTCWINLGDTYSARPVGKFNGGGKEFSGRDMDEIFASGKVNKTGQGVKEKSRMGIPERFYIHCIDDGWIARNHIPWYKANSMPSSIKDRFTNKWESIFFFAKEKKYYFNLDAVRIPTLTDSEPFNIRVRENITGRAQLKLGDQAWTASEEEMKGYNRDGTRKKQDETLGADGKPIPTYKGFNARWQKQKEEKYGNDDKGSRRSRVAAGLGSYAGKRKEHDSLQYSTSLDRIKQKRLDGVDHEVGLGTVENFDGIERFGTGKWQRHYDKDGNCLGCGEHYTKHTVSQNSKDGIGGAVSRSEEITWCNSKGKNPGDVFFINPRPFPDAHFATFPPELPEKIIKCACPEGGTVLDCFFGSGTVGLVAEQLNKKWIGIELSEEYIEICKKRLAPYNSIRLDEFV
ncbi:hypothetical protein LCGC14_0372500 [marine sediment metagenome]|uniref:DNA methylase N-4/N-6 domain-containing protein n=1 Tax=marine sediment metagenome TaxID=412755 RepID=A0A0F9TAL0_9ZZZZ